MTRIPVAQKAEVHADRKPKRIGFAAQTVRTTQGKTVPNLEVDQKDA